MLADDYHAVADIHRGQVAAAIERLIADACHTVGDGHWGQAAAFFERIIADAGHAFGNNEFRYLCILIAIKMMC